MSFVREALRDKPQLLCLMDDGSPYLDYSGYNRVVTSPAAVAHYGFVSGADTLPVLLSSANVTYTDVPVWRTGWEKQDFTLEAWVRIAATSYGEQQVLGNVVPMDGLLINNTVVSFAIGFSDNSIARIDYDMQRAQVAHLVAVYTPAKISLYLNGVLVGELALTESQQASTFTGTSTNFVSGQTAVSQRIAIGGVGIYASALDSNRILRHYLVGRDTPRPVDVVTAWGGEYIHATVDDFERFIDFTWETAEDWNGGSLNNVLVDNDALVPAWGTDTGNGVPSLPGKWYDAITLDDATTGTIYGVTLDWDGKGVTVETSVNGTTWEVTTRGIRPGNSRLITPAGKTLQIRVSFPGGIVNDDSYIRNLRVVGIASATSRKIGDRTITLTGAHPQFAKDEQTLNQDEGILLNLSTDTMVISADQSPEANPIRTVVVMWARTGSTVPSVTLTGASGTVTTYENGNTGDGIGATGSWTLSHFAVSANFTGAITITAQAQIGWVALLPTELTAAQVDEFYWSLTGRRIVPLDDVSTIAIPESDTDQKIYAHDWSILAGG